MNIEDVKNEFKKMRLPMMDISAADFKNLEDFVLRIRKQDRSDEKYILHNKMIPVLIGLFFITIIMIFNPIKNLLMLTGMFLIFSGLFSTFILLLRDFRNILIFSHPLQKSLYPSF